MHWNVVAPFFDSDANRDSSWLAPFVPQPDFRFTSVRRPDREKSWHNRSKPITGYDEWLGLWQQGRTAVRTVEDGVITVLPQLASLVGMQKTVTGQPFPLVAWWFNTNYYAGIKRSLSRVALCSVNRFVVHQKIEREAYSQWLGLPLDRFEFVPMQTPIYPITESEETEQPFIVSVGSAYRDYPLLFEAVQKLGFRTIVVSGPRVLQGLDRPACVETPFGVKKPEIISLLQRAKLVVLPLREEGLIAGTAAIVESLGVGCPMIVSNRQGVTDYIREGETGLLVKPRSLSHLTEAIDRLWHDDSLRDRLRRQAREYALQNLTDAAAGANLGRILSEVSEEIGITRPQSSIRGILSATSSNRNR
jgi:glycosyltransferase involved in cell wall biosynthesis